MADLAGGQPTEAGSACSGRIPWLRGRPRANAGTVSVPDDSFSMSGGFPAGPGRLGDSGPGQGGDGLAAVQMRPAPGFGEALRLAAVAASA